MSDSVAVKPVIDRDSFDDLIKLKAGQDFSINVKFFGEPPPKAKWTRGNKVLALVVFCDRLVMECFKNISQSILNMAERYEGHLLLCSHR